MNMDCLSICFLFGNDLVMPCILALARISVWTIVLTQAYVIKIAYFSESARDGGDWQETLTWVRGVNEETSSSSEERRRHPSCHCFVIYTDRLHLDILILLSPSLCMCNVNSLSTSFYGFLSVHGKFYWWIAFTFNHLPSLKKSFTYIYILFNLVLVILLFSLCLKIQYL